MSMPQIPDGKHRPSMEQTQVDLLESIALEEIAISHILNAQGEKTQEIIKKFGENQISNQQMQCGCRDTQDMLHSLIMKEWLLYIKLRAVMDMPVATEVTTLENKQEKAISVAPPQNCDHQKLPVCKAYMPRAQENTANLCCENCIHYAICAQQQQGITL